jgi:NNP family nitrate/nitrite transporter-like MFS transporter
MLHGNDYGRTGRGGRLTDFVSYKDRVLKFLSFGLLLTVMTHVLVHAAGNMRNTLLPFLKKEFTLTNPQIGLIAAIPSLVQVLFAIPTGFLSDRFGAKRLIALSILMAVIGAVLGGMSVNPWMYIAATTLLILTSTLYHPAAQSYTISITPTRDRARALGVWNGGGTFGVSLGPLSISILMGIFAFQWRQVYLFWVLPILCGFVALVFLRDSTDVTRRVTMDEEGDVGTARNLFSMNMISFLLFNGIRRFGGSMTSGFLSIWLVEVQRWSPIEVGLMFGASSLMGIVASPLGGELATRFGEKRWAVITLFGSYTCFVLAITLQGFWPFLVCYLAQRFFGILAMAANASIVAHLSPPRQRGVGFALSSLPGSLMGFVAPIVAALIADGYGMYPIFIASAVIYYLGLGIFQFGVKIDRVSEI